MTCILVSTLDFLHFVAHMPTRTKHQCHENDYFCIFLHASAYNIIPTFKPINHVFKDLNKLPQGYHIFNDRKEKRGFLKLITSDFMHICYVNTFKVYLYNTFNANGTAKQILKHSQLKIKIQCKLNI